MTSQLRLCQLLRTFCQVTVHYVLVAVIICVLRLRSAVRMACRKNAVYLSDKSLHESSV